MIRCSKKLPANVLEKIPEVVEGLSGNRQIVAFYIMGSAATGNLKPLSDLDFGVLLSAKIPKRQLFDTHLSLLGYLNRKLQADEVDLVLLNKAPVRMAYNIIKDGRLLLCRNEKELTDFLDDTVRIYLDFKFFLDDFDSTFLRMIGYRG
jgi:predicted nucleotidyltransferase